jgi:DNA polymerase I
VRTLYLVDGFALVFRAYYALIRRPLINSKQQNTGAVHNFFRMLLRFLRAERPEELAVVFDARGKNFRHELYPEYKANRAKAPEDLIAQLPWIRELVTLFGIPSVSMEGYEADDLIAAFARYAEGRDIRILTGDKDLMQLVNDQVRILVPAQDPTALFDEFGQDEVRAKYGVPPEAIPDYLAIAGDSSDNIPGVPGIGEKGALQLLSK